ncbi:hypothetical protein F0266_14915 [Vibrio coralliilyticus]|nr:single-stranded DNA-binding protein [Vibrio coralliilyticus]NOH54229.1 hypothetical protein [Vibrio coralliilyticus]
MLGCFRLKAPGRLRPSRAASLYKAGIYTVDSSSFIVNNYGKLELNKYGLKLVNMEPEL